jgi:hypothetical protein
MMADLQPTLDRRSSPGHGPAWIMLLFWGFLDVDLATTQTVVIESSYSRVLNSKINWTALSLLKAPQLTAHGVTHDQF